MAVVGGGDGKNLKSAAKEAKLRLKSGFWQDFKNDLSEEVQRAEVNGLNASKVVRYYTEKIENDLKGKAFDEEFYQKVKKLLEEFGEASDMLRRLTDKEYFDKLDYEQKQRYTLKLSERYRVALERYKREKEFEK